MRLEEWQKWLDAQFLDAPAKGAPAEEPAQPAAQPWAGQPKAVPPPPEMKGAVAVPSTLPPAPPALTPAPSAAPRREPEPRASTPASPPGPADDTDVPTIETYLPFLRHRQQEPDRQEPPAQAVVAPPAEPVPAAEPAPEPAPPDGPGAAPVAAEPTAAVSAEPAAQAEAESPPGAPSAEPAAPEAPANLDSATAEPAAGAAEEDASTSPATAPAEPARRYGVSHRRARHARNVRPDDLLPELDANALWSLVPRHIEALVAMGDDEIARGSYKREFRESRLELIRRLLDPTLSLEDAARLLNVCPTTVRRYTNRGLLTHQRTQGDQRRFKLSDVLAFLEAQSQARK